jgi:DNA-binding MarR family transcriptional regulator
MFGKRIIFMEKVGYKIKLLYNKFRSEIERNEIFQKSVLTRTEFIALKYVLMQKELKCMRDIQEEFNINRSTASELLSSLENKGCVEKIINENDSRIKYIQITDLGKKEFKTIIKQFEMLDNDLVSALTDEEVEVFNKLLDKIIDSEYFKKGELYEKNNCCKKQK